MYDFDYLRTDRLVLTNRAAETVLNNTKSSLLTELPSDFAISSLAAGTGAAVRVGREVKRKKSKKKKY